MKIHLYRLRILEEVTRILSRVDDTATEAFLSELQRAKRIYISGVGRSGLVVKAFGQRLMHLGFQVHLADEITAPAIARGDILVACSGTGSTKLTLYMARKAKTIGARVVSVSAAPRSPLSKSAHLAICLPVEIARKAQDRQPGRSAFEQGLFLYLDSLILALMHRRRIPGSRIERRHGNLE